VRCSCGEAALEDEPEVALGAAAECDEVGADGISCGSVGDDGREDGTGESAEVAEAKEDGEEEEGGVVGRTGSEEEDEDDEEGAAAGGGDEEVG